MSFINYVVSDKAYLLLWHHCNVIQVMTEKGSAICLPFLFDKRVTDHLFFYSSKCLQRLMIIIGNMFALLALTVAAPVLNCLLNLLSINFKTLQYAFDSISHQFWFQFECIIHVCLKGRLVSFVQSIFKYTVSLNRIESFVKKKLLFVNLGQVLFFCHSWCLLNNSK